MSESLNRASVEDLCTDWTRRPVWRVSLDVSLQACWLLGHVLKKGSSPPFQSLMNPAIAWKGQPEESPPAQWLGILILFFRGFFYHEKLKNQRIDIPWPGGHMAARKDQTRPPQVERTPTIGFLSFFLPSAASTWGKERRSRKSQKGRNDKPIAGPCLSCLLAPPACLSL